MAMIGMKIANGQFYPLLDEGIAKKKKLMLAAAHANQKSVQINLYKSGLSSMADAQYLGSLAAEIGAGKEKDPSIEMTISSNGKGEISASAKAAGSDKIQHLTVSIPSPEETASGISDEELEQAGSVPNALFDIPPAKKIPSLPILLIALLLAAAGIWFFLFWNKNAGNSPADAPETEAARIAASDGAAPAPAASPDSVAAGPNTAPAQSAEAGSAHASPPPVQPAAEMPAASGTAPGAEAASLAATAPGGRPAAVQKAPAPVRSLKAPAKIPAGGVRYTVRWGDTLWDIADVFYNDPWLTNRLARYNKIRNKNVLIPGITVRIPQKSKLY